MSKRLIYAEDAIDAIARMAREKFNLSDEFNHYLAGLLDADAEIRRLPSAQPKIIKCKDCKNRPLKTWFDCPLSHLPFDGERWCWKGEQDDSV